MSFLHALATKRKKLKEAGDVKALMKLPSVTVYEKSDTPGGVWKANRNEDGSTNMYDGLWINGHKDGMEFFDYTFKEHFKSPQPVYLPREQVLEYIMKRVTQHENIFEDVNFNTEVMSVAYDDNMAKFVIQTKNNTGTVTVEHFDKCIWAAGINGRPYMVPEIVQKLAGFKGQIVHSTEMSKLSTSEINAVKGQRILLIGDGSSAEDLALQCIKLGAERIFVASRSGVGSTCEMGSWPEDKVDILKHAQVSGIKDDGLGTTVTFDVLHKDHSAPDAENVSIIIFCTGYSQNVFFLPKELRPFVSSEEEEQDWCLEDVGLNTATWNMKSNVFSKVLGHVEPSKELATESHEYGFFMKKLYRNLLITNPNMMFIFERYEYPLLEIDVSAWMCLAFITGERQIPTKTEMRRGLLSDLLDGMHDPEVRYTLDENYEEAWESKIPKDHWERQKASDKYKSHLPELREFAIKIMARDMKEANYPIQFGDFHQLNKTGKEMLRMMVHEEFSRYNLVNCDDETKRWVTFRDADPTPYRSFISGMESTSLKGKWLEIDDKGEPHHIAKS